MDKKDAGVSVVIIFVMVLAVLVIIVAIWAVLGIPGQINEMNYQHSFKVENGFGDYQTMLYAVYNSNREVSSNKNLPSLEKVVYSTLLPIGMTHSQGTLKLKHGAGSFTSTETGDAVQVDRLSVTFTSGSEIGLEGGGVFRRDGNTAHWIIRPFYDSREDKYYPPLVLPRFTDSDELYIGTNSDVALDTWLVNPDPFITGTMIYQSDDAWDAQLWHEYFYEMQKGESSVVSNEIPLYGVTREDPPGTGAYFWVKLPYGISAPEFSITLKK